MKKHLPIFLLLVVVFSSCYRLQKSSGGGQRVDASQQRTIDTADIALPEGYKIELVARNLNFPTGVAFDPQGGVYVCESGYAYGEVFTEPRLLRINQDGSNEIIASGDRNGPWNGVFFYENALYVSEGGQTEGGRILKFDTQGNQTILIDGLPGMGDHHTNGPVVHNGYIYFGQGTATNSGIVGEDSYQFGWLERFPSFHDIPCKDITLSGFNYVTKDFLQPDSNAMIATGAYLPFGIESQPGQVIAGQVPCTGSVLRMPLQGGEPELVAWGFRNPYGLAFDNQGNLFIADNGYDDRGSRPIWGTGDYLWKVEQDTWYGWPDYSGGHEIATQHFKVPGGEKPKQIFLEHPEKPPHPAAFFGVHSSSNGIDFSHSSTFGFEGEAFVAQFGDMAPGVGKVINPVGFKVVRVNTQNGVVLDFAINKQGSSPASKLEGGGLERPVAVRFTPQGDELYIVDFGLMLTSQEGPRAIENTGVLWKVSKK